MLSHLDPVFLARAQFAFTVAYHITFPAFTIGLASWLAVVEWRWLKTGNPLYEQIYRMWVKIFAVTFGMGVVTGVVLSYQFGTNWSVFADQVGNVLGPCWATKCSPPFSWKPPFWALCFSAGTG
jgi:cytochrome d ubiquinol oxidase subunit I